MLDRIQNALKQANITLWRINEDRECMTELFFIRKKLDMRRQKDVTRYRVTVFRDHEAEGKACRGFAEVILHPGMTEEEIGEKLSSAYNCALYVANAAFEAAEPARSPLTAEENALTRLPPGEAAMAMAKALYAADDRENAFINSAEIFILSIVYRVLTGEGTDVTYREYKAEGEFVVQCKTPKDVELYQAFSYDDLAADALTEKAARALTTVQDRAKAESAPLSGQYTLLLSDESVKTLLDYYAEKADASMVYAKYSSFAPGVSGQGENIKGEKLNITLKPHIPFSPEGVPMKDIPLLKEGVVQNLYGNTRFCRYLSIAPTGYPQRMQVDNGTVSFAEMKKQPHLHVVSFSDFQMDSFSGRFGGEIRLGYLFDGENTTLVTGGSVSGSLLEAQSALTFSTDRYNDRIYSGPMAIRLENVSVAGR